MKYPEWSLFSEQVTVGFSLTYAEGTHSNYYYITKAFQIFPCPHLHLAIYSDLGERNSSCDIVFA